MSVQAQVLNLMQDLQQQFGITYMLISHDLAVVNHLCDEVVVLYQAASWSAARRANCSATRSTRHTQSLVGAVPQCSPTARRARRAATAAATAKPHNHMQV